MPRSRNDRKRARAHRSKESELELGIGPFGASLDQPPSFPCCICFDSGKLADEGIKCSCDEFVCRECVVPLAKTFANKELTLRERDDGRLKCPGDKCSGEPYYYPEADLAKQLPQEIFALFFTARLEVHERKIRLEAKLEVENKVRRRFPEKKN